jgi:hypothetical protein
MSTGFAKETIAWGLYLNPPETVSERLGPSVSYRPFAQYLAKLETSHKLQLIADMIGITKWARVGREITEFAGSQYA